VPITYGSDLSTDRDLARRTWSALINSFLHPAMETFLYNAESRLREYRIRNPLLIFRNDGAASRVAKTVAIKTYSSGPRGGMEGVKDFARLYGLKDAVSMDVGGTTTDYGHVHLDQVGEQARGLVEGVEVSFPLCDIISIGAGGSSVFKAENGKIKIGPESVGAVPGPACFARGGKEATITDACLLIGIFDPVSYFGGGLRIDLERARQAVKTNIADPLKVTVEEAVLLMLQAYEQKIADELVKFSKPIPETTLLAFGGAGPLNACGVAEKAGIKTVIIPKLAAVFSAYGIGTCDVAQSYQVTVEDLKPATVQSIIDKMRQKAERDMFAEGFGPKDYQEEIKLIAWFGATNKSIPVTNKVEIPNEFTKADFVEVDLTATKVLKTDHRQGVGIHKKIQASPSAQRTLQQDGQVPVYRLADMSAGSFGAGPALIEEDYFTSVIRPGWSFVVSDAGDIVLSKG
jgi:N-methylhydantoinase A/oxoprolinase/acetone carboxylase beta subunit